MQSARGKLAALTKRIVLLKKKRKERKKEN
jgi:hypothetical protein